MHKIVIISKTGGVSTTSAKGLTLDSLYKKCKFRKADDFAKRSTWKDKDNWVSVYARNTGRAGGENKYDLPPPIDKELYFGAMVVIRHGEEEPSNSNIKDLTHEEWKTIYEKCMGGFEDIEQEEEESEEEEIPDHLKTAQGYMKDGFVVDDEPEDDEDEEDDEVEEYLPNTEEDDDDEDEADYGGETGDEEDYTEDSDDEEFEGEDSDEGNGSELGEDEYDYDK